MNDKFEKYTDPALHEEYYVATHGSGLKIYVFPKRRKQKTALLGVHFGSLYESGATVDGERREYPSGIAHYLEHLMFLDSEGGDVTERLAELGADANAYTSSNKTVYFFTCIDGFLPSLHELLTFVASPSFTEANVESERPVIVQEIKMCRDNPYDALSLLSLRALYGEGKLSEDILGDEESIANITPEMLEKCYGDFYRFSNMALAVCGDVEPDDVYDEVTKALGSTDTRGDAPTIPTFDYSESAESAELILNMPVATTLGAINIKDSPPDADPCERTRRDALMSVVNELIFSRSGELYADLLESGAINDSYSYGYSISAEAAFNTVWVESDRIDEVVARIRQRISELATGEIDGRRIERIKRVMRAEFVRDFDSVDEIANMLISSAFEEGDIFEYGRALDAVDPESVRKCITESFSDDRFAIGMIKK